jgi:hypothetical protein
MALVAVRIVRNRGGARHVRQTHLPGKWLARAELRVMHIFKLLSPCMLLMWVWHTACKLVTGSSRSARPHEGAKPVFARTGRGLITVWVSFAQVTRAAEVQKLSDGGMLPVILHFWAGWAPMCAQTKEIASRLAGECPNVRFANVEAEEAEVCYNTAAHVALSVCTTMLSTFAFSLLLCEKHC